MTWYTMHYKHKNLRKAVRYVRSSVEDSHIGGNSGGAIVI